MLTATRPELAVPDASLVVLAGLPGAGKTTLLRRIAASAPPGVLALDAEDVAARIPVGRAGYPLVRPFVHTVHLARVVAALAGPARCVLTTDPMTGPVRRLLLGTAARLTVAGCTWCASTPRWTRPCPGSPGAVGRSVGAGWPGTPGDGRGCASAAACWRRPGPCSAGPRPARSADWRSPSSMIE